MMILWGLIRIAMLRKVLTQFVSKHFQQGHIDDCKRNNDDKAGDGQS